VAKTRDDLFDLLCRQRFGEQEALTLVTAFVPEVN
jgi:hypothetical protein